MTTIYTFNNKVLKNAANDKWLKKKEAPIPANGVKIGNLIWSKFRADVNNVGLSARRTATVNGVTYSYYRYSDLAKMLLPEGGWRIPTTADFDNLINTVGATTSNTNWAKLFMTYSEYWSTTYTNDYGTDWDEQVGFYYNSNSYSCCLGWYDSTQVICGNYGSLKFETSSYAPYAPIVFCQDA